MMLERVMQHNLKLDLRCRGRGAFPLWTSAEAQSAFHFREDNRVF
jgi:hypothetical protein